jgi:hypothetical protein
MLHLSSGASARLLEPVHPALWNTSHLANPLIPLLADALGPFCVYTGSSLKHKEEAKGEREI